MGGDETRSGVCRRSGEPSWRCDVAVDLEALERMIELFEDVDGQTGTAPRKASAEAIR